MSFNKYKTLMVMILLTAAAFCLSVGVCTASFYYAMDEIQSYSVCGYSGTEEIFAPEDDNILYLDMNSSTVEASHKETEFRDMTSMGVKSLWAMMEKIKEESNGIALDFDLKDQKIRTNDYNTMVFGLGIIGGYTGCSGYLVYASIYTSDGNFYTQFSVERPNLAFRYSAVYLNLKDVTGFIEKISLTVTYKAGSMPIQVRITDPYLSYEEMEGFENINSISTDAIRENDMVVDHHNLKPDENGLISVWGQPNNSFLLEDGDIALATVSISGADGGLVKMGYMYLEDESRTENYSESQKITEENDAYTFPVMLTGTPIRFHLVFEQLSEGQTVSIERIKITYLPTSSDEYEKDMGSVSSIVLNQDGIKFSGTVTRDTVKKYQDGQIVIYAVSNKYVTTLNDYIELGRIKITTRFEFSIPNENLPVHPEEFKYCMGIMENDTVHMISIPQYASYHHNQGRITGRIGLAGASPAGVFDSNVPYVLVNVDLYEFFAVQTSAEGIQQIYSYLSEGEVKSETMRISSYLISFLDRNLDFYTRAGTNIYLRIILSGPVDGLTSELNDEYYINVFEEDHMAKYLAAVRFLSERYSIDGIVLDDSLMARDNDIYTEAHNLLNSAEICLKTYEVAAKRNENLYVVKQITREELREDAVNFAYTMELLGDAKWAVLLEINDIFEESTGMDRYLDYLKTLGIAMPLSVYLVSPSYNIASTLGQYSDNPEKYIENALNLFLNTGEKYSDSDLIFYSLENLQAENDQSFYSKFREMSELSGSVYEYSSSPADSETDTSEKYVIWDFSDKYHTLGWISGGGADSCYTDYSERGIYDDTMKRVLKVKIQDGAGIAIRNFDRAMDLSGVDKIEFEFSVIPEYEENREVSVVFFIGSEYYRAAFNTETEEIGKAIRVVCDISEYEHRNEVEYIGAEVYSKDPAVFELADVVLSSESSNVREIAEMFRKTEDAPKQEEHHSHYIAYAAAGVVIIITAITAVYAFRHDKEDKNIQINAKREERWKAKTIQGRTRK